MKWTKEIPTEEGFYWMKVDGAVEVFEIYEFDGKRVASFGRSIEPEHAYWVEYEVKPHWCFAGPIKEPEE